MYLLVTKQVKQVPCFVNFVNNFSLFRNFEKPIKFQKEDGSEKGIKMMIFLFLIIMAKDLIFHF